MARTPTQADDEAADDAQNEEIDPDKTFDLVADKWLSWKAISRHPNKKACKPWAQEITGTHEKYNVDGEWLEKKTIDGGIKFDVSGLHRGSIVKVSGASHNNRKHAYWRVEEVNGEFAVSRMDESAVIEEMTERENNGNTELRQQVRRLADECDDRNALQGALRALKSDASDE
jgi:hypothetical protein